MPAYQTIRGLLSDQVERCPDAPCLVHGDRCWSYAEFAAEVETVAQAFAALPLRPGQKVAILLPNCPEYLWTVFAMARTGGVFVPLNTAQTPGELKYLLAHSEARCLLTTAAFMPVIEGIRGDCPGLEHVVTLDAGGRNGVMGWDAFIGATDRGSELADVAPDDLASIIYTSGTTDRPKGVMLKHHAFAFAPSHRARALGWTEADRGAGGDAAVSRERPVPHDHRDDVRRRGGGARGTVQRFPFLGGRQDPRCDHVEHHARRSRGSC